MTDEIYMQRALELARIGIGQVSPNPRVGCVVVHQSQIIGEGWHQQFGLAHAEVNALTAVKDESLLPQSSLYVNLEPCSHQGKTPPFRPQ
jgi:diaminohydroxyphosphoribosylaminopyrimidine deaminase/5-amino-6-(5-phosphoribosylamino)uracil reductase